MDDDGDRDLSALLASCTIVQAIEAWAEAHPDEFMDAIRDGFDADQQLAVAARPVEVVKSGLRDGKLMARVNFKVTYKSPVDSEDRDLSAKNVTDCQLDVVLDAPVVEQFGFDDFALSPQRPFPA
jgi:hypothetical protein